ncbi:hypothetical protein TrispH2_001461 [Trichoplax sp. H2]|nr:hypothetical protein TrispH2_001461 [Trichoplax sp. H2]|eukprot:RDD46228.1 hypothetical protein TrispH2_001461 [Trichoplax sp. H2]
MDGKKALMRFTFLADADEGFRPRCSSEPVPKTYSTPLSASLNSNYLRQNSTECNSSSTDSEHVFDISSSHENSNSQRVNGLDLSSTGRTVYAVASPSVVRRSNRFITDAFTNFSKWIKPWKWKARKTSQFLQEKSIRKLF